MQVGNTFVSFYHVQGIAAGDTDLRDNLGAGNTGYVDDGAGATGDHSATIGYNNAAGNSYQFTAKAGAAGEEQLGAVAFISPGQCAIPAPAVPLVAVHNAVVEATISQAQCNGDKTSFALAVDLVSGGTQVVADIDAVVIDTDTNVPVLVVDESEMYKTPNLQAYYWNRTVPPGPWTQIVLVDIVGVGAVDGFDVDAFSVPLGTCLDLTQPIPGTNLTFLNTTLNQVNSTLGPISASIDAWFWLGLMVAGIVATWAFNVRAWHPGRWLALGFFLFAMLWAGFKFPDPFAAGVGFMVALIAFLYAASLKYASPNRGSR